MNNESFKKPDTHSVQGKKITIKTIAQETGLSFSTVSKALNGSPLVKPETQKTVLEKARELNYIPNMMARSLRAKSTRTVAIIMNDLVNSVLSTMLSNITRHMNELGYMTIYSDPQFNEKNEENIIKYILARQPDYVIYAPTSTNLQNLELLKGLENHLILFHEPIEGINCNYVNVDYEEGGYLSASTLIKAGHHDIQIITQPTAYPISQQFVTGIQKAFSDHGIPFHAETILNNLDSTIECGFDLLESLWDPQKNNYSRHFTGVITFCDIIAHGVYKNLLTHGKHIPEDVSVIGFDDNHFNEFSSPPLTTIKLPSDRMSEACISILVDSINDICHTPRICSIKPSLSIRKSIAEI